MTTYLLITSDKPTELTAFVGPKEPTQAEFNWGFAREHSDWKSSIETAKASRLPVVNENITFDWYPDKTKANVYGFWNKHPMLMKLDTPVELAGWEPEIVYQAFDDDVRKWVGITELFYNGPIVATKRQTYRLKRSEPVETHLTPDQRKQYEEAAKKAYSTWYDDYTQGSEMRAFIKGCEYAHSKIEEAEREAHNRALDEVADMVSNAFSGRSGDDLAHAEHEIIEELKKLRK